MSLNKVAILGLMLVACAPVPVSPPSFVEGCHFPEIEPNDNLETATFIAEFTPPSHRTFCGAFDAPLDQDVYRFFTPINQLTSFVITSDVDVPVEVFMYARDLEHHETNFLGHWIGDPGLLTVLNFPTRVVDDGFQIVVSTPAHTVTDYKVEIWIP